MSSIASGEVRLFHLGLYVTVKARDNDGLDEETSKIVALCAAMGFDMRTVELRRENPWNSRGGEGNPGRQAKRRPA